MKTISSIAFERTISVVFETKTHSLVHPEELQKVVVVSDPPYAEQLLKIRLDEHTSPKESFGTNQSA